MFEKILNTGVVLMIKKNYYSLPVFVLILIMACTNPASSGGDNSSLVINEFMVNNCTETKITDPTDSVVDWVELYNKGSESIKLKNIYISDNSDNPKKSQLADVVLKPNEFYVVWAGDHNIGFSFSTKLQKGEKVIISNSNGNTVDSFSYLDEADAVVNGKSYGRVPDGSDTWKQQTEPTPGESNKK